MCKFCKVGGGLRQDLILLETELSVVIANLFPIGDYSFLVIPKRHVVSIDEITKEESFDLSELTKKVVIQIKKKIKPDGLNIFINEGIVAGQTIPHLHCHIVARFNDDMIQNFKRGGTPYEISQETVILFREMMK